MTEQKARIIVVDVADQVMRHGVHTLATAFLAASSFNASVVPKCRASAGQVATHTGRAFTTAFKPYQSVQKQQIRRHPLDGITLKNLQK